MSRLFTISRTFLRNFRTNLNTYFKENASFIQTNNEGICLKTN